MIPGIIKSSAFTKAAAVVGLIAAVRIEEARCLEPPTCCHCFTQGPGILQQYHTGTMIEVISFTFRNSRGTFIPGTFYEVLAWKYKDIGTVFI